MDLFWTVAAVLLILWVLGLVGGIGGELINILVVSAVVVVAYRFFKGKDILTGK